MKRFHIHWKDSLVALGILTAAFFICLFLHNLPISHGVVGMVLLGQVQEDSENLIQMVQNLLMVTKANTDGIRLKKTETVLEELIDSTLVKFKKDYPQQAVETCIPDTFISIPMDATLIRQVLLNLLENAVIHGGTVTQLSLQVTTQGNRAVFCVRDDGRGIPSDRLENLFGGFGSDDSQPADSRRTGMGIRPGENCYIINELGVGYRMQDESEV